MTNTFLFADIVPIHLNFYKKILYEPIIMNMKYLFFKLDMEMEIDVHISFRPFLHIHFHSYIYL